MDPLKHHHIKFKQGPSLGSTAEWEIELKKIKGIKKLSIDLEKGDIFTEYDLLECREEDIERQIAEAGFVLDDSLMERLKRGWVHFTEENEQAELKSGPAPCCDIQGIERRKREMK